MLVASAASYAPSPAAIVQQDRAAAFRGVGTWVDIYDTRLLAHPEVIVRRSVAAGVRTIYVETGNFRQGADVVNRKAILQVIRRAHANGIRVVGWYLPGLVRPKLDRRRLIAAARLGSGSVRFDAIAFDIEASNVKKVNLRNRRLVWLADQVRAAVGTRVPLGAIIPSPPGMRLVPHYWPRFPYEQGEPSTPEAPTPAIELGSSGNLLVDVHEHQTHRMLEYNSDGNEIASFDAGGEDALHGLAYDPRLHRLYLLNTNGNLIPPVAQVRSLTPPKPNIFAALHTLWPTRAIRCFEK